jgi:glycosyltransferase involved in cell wall biosynthesis
VHLLYLADIRLPLERANGIQTMATCHALAARGHAVTLLTRPDTAEEPRDPFAFYGLPPIAGFTLARTHAVGPAAVRRAEYLLAALRRSVAAPAPDVVFTRDLGVAALLTRLPRGRRPPLVYESHGYAPLVSDLMPVLVSGAPGATTAKARRLARREARVWNLAEGYVTITRALAEELTARLGAREVTVVPDGARLDPHRTFDWVGPDRPPLVTYAGHLYPWKGVDVLIEALALAPDLRGRIVGGHPAEGDLARVRALAAARGLGERVTFTGLVPPHEVVRYLEAADVLVLPNRATAVSAHYTSPLKLFEYLAAGRPIVASALPALQEILEHNRTAWLVPPDDPRRLAEALVHVTTDRALAVRLARQAFAAATAFSWEKRAERLEAVLVKSVGSRKSEVGSRKGGIGPA